MKKLGFGLMRLPMNGDEVDTKALSKMVDYFMEKGFTYFDTAHGYVSGKSEPAIKTCLTSRYPRESYQLTDKLTPHFFNTIEDVRPHIESQLEICGVEYFDNYLMHAMNADRYKKYTECKAFETALELKSEGKIKHIGISFHDKADVLDMVLTKRPEIEIVQIQFNYNDFNDAGIQSKACYDVCVKHGKPVIVMEPVKGGALVNLPNEAKAILDNLDGNGSYASYAIRFAASFESIVMVLSGMSNMEQVIDNTSFMSDFKPFTDEEFEAVSKVSEILKSADNIPCTACHYCTDGCPKKIKIPELFSCYNSKKMFNDWQSIWYYGVYTADGGKASECINCKQCEKVCPQHLNITQLLKNTAEIFEQAK